MAVLRHLGAGLLLLLCCSMAASQTFTSVTSGLDYTFQYIVAVADINGDGRDDLVAVHQHLDNVGDEAEDRLIKTPLYFLFGEQDGTFTVDPGFVDGVVEARTPVVVVDDFNNDGKPDVAVFDRGIYSLSESIGLGNPPQLLLSSPDDDLLHHSGALADAVRREHEREIPPEGLPPNLEELHVKKATSGDIDGDGDVDLWIQSGGGLNVEEHFMVNNGDGSSPSNSSVLRYPSSPTFLPTTGDTTLAIWPISTTTAIWTSFWVRCGT